jgi:hypothetical protein
MEATTTDLRYLEWGAQPNFLNTSMVESGARLPCDPAR